MSETPFRLTRWNERLFSLYGPNNGCLSFNDKDYAAQALAYLNGEWNTLLARATAAEERCKRLEEALEDIAEGDPYRNLPHIARAALSPAKETPSPPPL